MLRVFYYNYYRYAIRFLKDEEPHGVTIMMLSATECFFLIFLISFLAAQFFCYNFLAFKINIMVLITIVLVTNYIIYNKETRNLIIKSKPVFFRNQKFSMVFTLITTLIIDSSLFWCVPAIKSLLKQCS
jgi:hypothetical protein